MCVDVIPTRKIPSKWGSRRSHARCQAATGKLESCVTLRVIRLNVRGPGQTRSPPTDLELAIAVRHTAVTIGVMRWEPAPAGNDRRFFVREAT